MDHLEGSGAVLEKLAVEYGQNSDIVGFIENWQLAPGKIIVSTVVKDKGRRRYWVVEDNPVKGRSLGYGREVRFGREFDDLEKIFIGSDTIEKPYGIGNGLYVNHESVLFFVINRLDIFAARVVL
jgi:hypothetical protein